MTPEEVFDMAVQEAETRIKLKPIVDIILEDPYSAAYEMVEMNTIIEKYKEKYGEL